jgi:hypothetical protein
MTLLRQGVKSGLQDIALVEVDQLLPEFSPFMLDVLEVIDSPAESTKCVHTRNEQEPEAWSGFVGFDGNQGHRQLRQGRPSPGQVVPD